MVHCPECETTIADDTDVEFVEVGAETNIFAASKRFYAAECAACGHTLGSGVAGAKAGGDAV